MNNNTIMNEYPKHIAEALATLNNILASDELTQDHNNSIRYVCNLLTATNCYDEVQRVDAATTLKDVYDYDNKDMLSITIDREEYETIIDCMTYAKDQDASSNSDIQILNRGFYQTININKALNTVLGHE